MTYLFGLLSPLIYALGIVMQQRGSLGTPAPEGDPRFLYQALRKPVWLGGLCFTVCGFFLQAAALRNGSLALIQSLQALTLVFVLPLGARFSGQSVNRRSFFGAVVTVCGLVVFILLGDPEGGILQPGVLPWLAAAGVALTVTGTLTWLAWRWHGRLAAALFGCGAGICFALQAGITKVLVTALHRGLSGVVSSWALYALVLVVFAGFVLQQAALKTGVLAPGIAALNVATLVASVILALAVFRETIYQGPLRLAAAVAGLAVAIVGVVLLASGGHPNTLGGPKIDVSSGQGT